MEKEQKDSITDLTYLAELAKGNTAFLKEMIRIFIKENPAEVQALEDAIKVRDFAAMNIAAHKLRSTIPFVGIEKLIEADIQEIETLAESNLSAQRIQIEPEENTEIRKIEIFTTDKTVIQRIERLFPRVKEVCERARKELIENRELVVE